MTQRGAGPQLADSAREFTEFFRELVAGLGAAPGWYGALSRRDPGGVNAYEAGVELAPWDVVHAVLHDLAALHGAPVDPADVGRAQRLYRAAAAGRDAAPGSGTALRSRLDAMLRERHDAVLREREAAHAAHEYGATGGDPHSVTAGRLANALAWARDDRERAGARCAELQARLDAVEKRLAGEFFTDRSAADRSPAPDDWFRPRTPDPVDPAGPLMRQQSSAAGPAGSTEPVAPAAPAGRGKRRPKAAGRGTGSRPRGARFATTFDEPFDEADDAASEAPRQEGPAATAAPGPAAGPAPRGARFAGVAAEEAPARAADVPPDAGPRQAEARSEAARLGGLRRAGRGGEAYVVLCEAAAGPAAALPVLARELERAGLAADVATLLWEVAVLPPDRLAAAAAALAQAGRTDDCRTLLHQAAARPAAEVAVLAAALYGENRGEEAGTLLGAVVRTRLPEEAAAVAGAHPGLTAPLLDVAALISRPRRRDIVAALRRAGLPDR
ncbi:hypothetical protein [Streptomyces sp. RKAG337]|uniref:hypothetical protein n=1 Tax=Streptomyces sp. RKAG337 TaxID=2893404 RepID=UPI002033D304|nr:hypothetical protein [Streptomyces sp. RKAG337]MCM2425394.1 hypothetical protein [Streptomyces sp. RKAG337]